MKTLKLIKRLFLLCLVVVGTQGAWADSGYKLEKEAATVGNLTFDFISVRIKFHHNESCIG